MRMMGRAGVARGLWALALALSAGCSGVLTIDPAAPCERDNQCDMGYVCNEELGRCEAHETPCSTSDPTGYCPVGHECVQNVCHCTDPLVCSCPDGNCAVTPCDCTPDQGCDSGQCVDIVTAPDPAANDCAPERPDGLCTENRACCEGGSRCCPAGEVCAGDHCVPVVLPCSPEHPTGYCEQPGYACFNGSCVPDDVCGCTAPATPCCPAGEACSGDSCQPVTCDAGVVGVCPAEQVCGPTGCEAIPCSLDHLGGSCPSQQYCSDTGACIPVGECRLTTDCGSSQYCSTANVCREQGVCASDGDCEERQADVYGQGFECVGTTCIPRVACADDVDCIPTEYCSVAGHCLSYPNCDGVGDCPTGVPGEPDEFCSYDGLCIDIETCSTDRDCPTGEFCAGSQCLTSGTCFEQAHCPPAHICQGAAPPDTVGTCVPDPLSVSCDSNDFTSLGCAPGEICCDTSVDPSATCCDPYTHHCSAADNCIPAGSCVNDGDCLGGYTSCIGYYCVPTEPKTEPECVAGEKYVVVQGVGGCIPADRCVVSADCAAAEFCDPEYRCQPVPGCDNRDLDAGGVVPPNVLIVVDRSGSMNLCGPGVAVSDPSMMCGYVDGGGICDDTNPTCDPGAGPLCDPDVGTCETGRVCYDLPPAMLPLECVCATGDPAHGTPTIPRWDEALSAIDFVTRQYAGRVNFGLSIYPLPHYYAGQPDSCGVECNWVSCTGTSNFEPGQVDSPMGSLNSAIMGALGATAPGGGTPTAPTLRAIFGLPDRGGLDDGERANAVLLVTDGEPNGDPQAVSVCAPPCADGAKNGDESDLDCGGSCSPCGDALACAVADDCQSGVCRGGLCRPATCTNGVADAGIETDVDCGGSCGGCAAGLACAVPQDCVSGECNSGRCAAATCTDGTKNGDETDLDCGGSCATATTPATCAVGLGCAVPADCTSGVCQASICRDGTCGNGVQDPSETDVDCGGSCGPCANAKQCTADADCASGWCDGTVCATPLCDNGVLDATNGETDVDCGGTLCEPCGPYRTCASAADCAGGSECSAIAPNAEHPKRVNYAIGRLYSADPRVKTFVVGFNMGGISNTLNCNSVYGRTARHDQGNCSSLTTAECATGATAACYYEASDQTTLETAFDEILTKVSSCRYLLSEAVIPYWDAVYAYLQSPDGTRVRVERYTGWELNGVGPSVEFFGAACEQLKAGAVRPLVTIHCTPAGG